MTGSGAVPVPDIATAAAAAGFECVGRCDPSALVLRQEVRAMCASGQCRVYGTNWACPPHCGDLGHFQQQIDARNECILVQTVALLEDEFDGESMAAAADLHRRRMEALARALDPRLGAMVLAAGPCGLCEACPCPQEPCRFPQQRLVSMEAAGIVVSEACQVAGIPYNHGPCTIAYTGCVLAGMPPP